MSVPPVDHPGVGSVWCEVTHSGGAGVRVPHFHTYVGSDGVEVRVYVDESGVVSVSEMLWHTVMTSKFGATLVSEEGSGVLGRMGGTAPGEGAPREDES